MPLARADLIENESTRHRPTIANAIRTQVIAAPGVHMAEDPLLDPVDPSPQRPKNCTFIPPALLDVTPDEQKASFLKAVAGRPTRKVAVASRECIFNLVAIGNADFFMGNGVATYVHGGPKQSPGPDVQREVCSAILLNALMGGVSAPDKPGQLVARAALGRGGVR